MKTRCYILLFVLALLGPGATSQAEPAPVATVVAESAAVPAGQVTLTAQIFRIRGSVSGDTSLTDNIWAGSPPKGEDAKALTFFTLAKLKVAGHGFAADERGWQWDGKPLPLGTVDAAGLGENLVPLASPRVKVAFGQPAQIDLASGQDIEYFIPRGGRLYELKTMERPTGISLRVPLERGRDGRIALKGLELTSRLVEKRKPLEGTTLNIGEPVVSERAIRLDLQLQPARDYGFLFFTSDGQGMLLVRLRLDPEAAG